MNRFIPVLGLALMSCLWLAPLRAQAPESLADGWPTADPVAQHWEPARLRALEARIAETPLSGITSVLIAQNGTLVYERYFNGGDRDTLNDVRSASKSLTALMVGMAIDRGRIPGVEARVYPFFPEHAQPQDPRKAAITLEDLLTMSSLWECDDDNPFSSGNEERMYVTEHWLGFALDLPIKGFAPWMTRPEQSPYGRAFSYCTAGSFVAGAVVERATGQRLDQFAAEALETPLGIRKSRWNLSPEGIGMGGGGTRYRSRDLAKFGELLLDGGRWKGQQVVSADWIKSSMTPRAQARDDAEYGYLLWRLHFEVGGERIAVWAMSGNGGNYVFVWPERRLVAVITSTAFNQRNAHAQSQGLMKDFILPAAPPR